MNFALTHIRSYHYRSLLCSNLDYLGLLLPWITSTLGLLSNAPVAAGLMYLSAQKLPQGQLFVNNFFWFF